MNNFGLQDSDIKSIIEILLKNPLINEAYIFGSRAKGNFKTGSDVDIAVKGRDIDTDLISKVSCTLNEETLMPSKFDVIDYNSIVNKDLTDHIDRIGIKIL